MHWSAPFYKLIDAGDPAAAEMLADNIYVQVGNHAPTIGLAAMMAGELGRHSQVTKTSVHNTQNIYDVAESTALIDSIVTYNRRDGVDVTIPVMTMIRRNNEGKIELLRLFLDNTPLYALFINQ